MKNTREGDKGLPAAGAGAWKSAGSSYSRICARPHRVKKVKKSSNRGKIRALGIFSKGCQCEEQETSKAVQRTLVYSCCTLCSGNPLLAPISSVCRWRAILCHCWFAKPGVWLCGFRLHFGYNPRDGQQTETKLFKVDILMLVVVSGLGSPVNFSSASCIDKKRPVAVHHLYPAHQHLLSSPLVSFCWMTVAAS